MGDLDFLRRCIQGENASWDIFVKRYSRLIYSYICGILKRSLAPELIQDYAQDIFQGLFAYLVEDNFKKLRTFKAKNGCSLASWLRQVTVNYTIDFLRRERQMISLEEENDDGLNLKDTIADSSLPVSLLTEQHEDLSILKECFERLGFEEKLFLEFHFNQNLKLKELMRVFKTSRAAIDMRKKRIILQLKECFKIKGYLLDL